MRNNFGLGFVFEAVDKFSGTVNRIGGAYERMERARKKGTKEMNKSLAMETAGMTTLGVAGAGLRKALSFANVAGEFEQGLAGLQAVSQASAEELGKARDRVVQAGMDTQFSPMEALAGMQQLVTAGQTLADAGEVLTPVLDLAAGSLGKLSVDDAADAVVGTLNAYGESAEKATEVTNKLLRITQLTNFATNDFQGALSKAAANGAQFGTSLSDTLISVGLLRNANIDASSSGTAFRESIRRVVAFEKAQNAVLATGVEIFDKHTGAARSIVDITMDLVDKTADWNEQQRNLMLNTAFGARGLLMYNAVAKAQFIEMKNGEKITHKGRDAIRQMRIEMAISEGNMQAVTELTAGLADQHYYLQRAQKEGNSTAKQFRETLLDTYAGQKTLAEGVSQTISVLIGEPFTKVLKPITASALTGLNAFAEGLSNMSPVAKQAAATLFLVTTGTFLLLGSWLASRAALKGLRAGLQLLGLSLKSVAFSMLKIVAAGGILIGSAYLIYRAYKTNFGGFADYVNKLVSRVRLLYDGLVQVFTQGGFTGAVRKELNKAENAGIKRFIINVYALFARLKVFFEGVADGFAAAWVKVGPSVSGMFTALKDVVLAFFGIFAGADETVTNTSMNSWRLWGETVAGGISFVLNVFATLVGWFARLIGDHPTLTKYALYTYAAYKLLYVGVMGAAKAIDRLILYGFGPMRRATMLATKAMAVFRFVVGGVTKAFGLLRAAVLGHPVIATAVGLATAAYLVYEYWEPISDFFSGLWDGVADAFNKAIDWIIGKLSWVMDKIRQAKDFVTFQDTYDSGAAAEQRGKLNSMSTEELTTLQNSGGIVGEQARAVLEGRRKVSGSVRAELQTASAFNTAYRQTEQARTTVVAEKARAAQAGYAVQGAMVSSEARAMFDMMRELQLRENAAKGTQNINLMIDGEKLATVVAAKGKAGKARTFSPVDPLDDGE